MRTHLVRLLTILTVAAVAVFGVGQVTDVDAAGTQDTVYLATGDNFPDALGVGPVAALTNAPVLFVQKNSIPAATLTELNRLQPDTIVIVGGEAVIAPGVVTALEALSFRPTVERLWGTDRYATAAAISSSRFPTELDADTLDGKNASDFLGVNAKAADANQLDGRDSSYFLPTSGKAADANLLDGRDSRHYQATAAYAAGNQAVGLYQDDTTLRTVSLDIHVDGTVIVNSTVTVEATAAAGDFRARCSITREDTLDFNYLQQILFPENGAMIQLAGTRGYDVMAGGTFKVNLVCNRTGEGPIDGFIDAYDSSLTAIFTPDA